MQGKDMMMTGLITDEIDVLTLSGAAQAALGTEDVPGNEAEPARGPGFLRALPRQLWVWMAPRRDNDLNIFYSTHPHLMDDIGFVPGRGQDTRHR